MQPFAQLSPQRMAWRVASVAVGTFVVIVALLAGMRAWSLSQGFSFQTIPGALPSVTADAAFRTRDGGRVAAGTQELDADGVLGYLRPDPAMPGAEELAVRNQQQLIQVMLGEAVGGNMLTNLRLLGELSAQVTPFIAVDETLTPEYLAGLELKLDDIRRDVVFDTFEG